MFEYLDIYDAAGIPTGRRLARDDATMYKTGLGPGDRLLLAHLCLFDSKGRMLIQQRQRSKKTFPGLWDVSCGGHADSGEDSLTAVLRECEEELGIPMKAEDLKFFRRIPFSYVLDDFYLTRSDLLPADFTLQEEELAAVRWASRSEVLEMRRSGDFVDYDYDLLEDLFQAGSDLI